MASAGVPGPIEALVRRDRLIVAAGLALLATLAWLWLLGGGGTGMSVRAMSRAALFPGAAGGGGAAGAWPASAWLVMAAMWWSMMVAMMIPAAAPTILLHARIARHAQATGRAPAGPVGSGAFLAGYLTAWLGFSLAATALQWGSEQAGLLSQPMMWAVDRWLAGGLLVAAGLYQLTPAKRACLRHCRSPAAYLAGRWRPGRTAALRMGLGHGAYCVGCCWVLMALLFVGGIMNAYWIAGLTIVVVMEKLLPRGEALAALLGPAFVLAGLWIAAGHLVGP